MTNAQFIDLIGGLVFYPGDGWEAWLKHRNSVFRDIRKLAASALAQDEVRGQRSAERKGKK